jgi:hypothetical protein
MGLGPFACWDSAFEFRQRHRYLSLVSAMCCQVQVCASGWSLVQRSSTECVCVWVCSWSLEREEETLAHSGLSRHGKNIICILPSELYILCCRPAAGIALPRGSNPSGGGIFCTHPDRPFQQSACLLTDLLTCQTLCILTHLSGSHFVRSFSKSDTASAVFMCEVVSGVWFAYLILQGVCSHEFADPNNDSVRYSDPIIV